METARREVRVAALDRFIPVRLLMMELRADATKKKI
jgi:hypothetical protein